MQCVSIPKDPRFKSIVKGEFAGLDLSISILGAPHIFPVDSEEDLVTRLRPHVDGLILQHGQKHALFLPHVWEQLPEPLRFVRHLKSKAKIPVNEWPDGMRVKRFSTENFASAMSDIDLS